MDLERDFPGTWFLRKLPVSVKVLFTGYLLVIGLGLLMAGGQILLTHGMADGEWGLSKADIVYSYYGKRDGSTLEAKLNGSMRDKAPPDVRIEMIQYARAGAPRSEWEPRFKGLFQKHCVQCHSVTPGLSDFRDYEAVKTVAGVDEGATVDKLARVSHIHLFGIAFIFFLMGLIFVLAENILPWVKYVAIATPFAFLIVDVFSWWATKYYPGFAWLTIVGGIGYSLASAYMWLVSLYQMWVWPMTRPG